MNRYSNFLCHFRPKTVFSRTNIVTLFALCNVIYNERSICERTKSHVVVNGQIVPKFAATRFYLISMKMGGILDWMCRCIVVGWVVLDCCLLWEKEEWWIQRVRYWRYLVNRAHCVWYSYRFWFSDFSAIQVYDEQVSVSGEAKDALIHIYFYMLACCRCW